MVQTVEGETRWEGSTPRLPTIKCKKMSLLGGIEILFGIGELIFVLTLAAFWRNQITSSIYAFYGMLFAGFAIYAMAGTLATNCSTVTSHRRWLLACLIFCCMAILQGFVVCMMIVFSFQYFMYIGQVNDWKKSDCKSLLISIVFFTAIAMFLETYIVYQVGTLHEMFLLRNQGYHVDGEYIPPDQQDSRNPPPEYTDIFHTNASGVMNLSTNNDPYSAAISPTPITDDVIQRYKQMYYPQSRVAEEAPPPSYDYAVKYLVNNETLNTLRVNQDEAVPADSNSRNTNSGVETEAVTVLSEDEFTNITTGGAVPETGNSLHSR